MSLRMKIVPISLLNGNNILHDYKIWNWLYSPTLFEALNQKIEVKTDSYAPFKGFHVGEGSVKIMKGTLVKGMNVKICAKNYKIKVDSILTLAGKELKLATEG